MEVFGLDMPAECIVMVERPSRTLKVKGAEIMCIADNFKMDLCFGGTFSGND